VSNQFDTKQHTLYQESVDFYEAHSEGYDADRWTTPAGRYLNEVQIRVVSELVNTAPGKTHLDIATGTGRFAVDLAQRGANVTALDSSQGMLAETNKRAAAFNVTKKLKARLGYANDMGFKNQFDTCTCINALCHIPDQSGVMQSAAQALKANGVLVTNYTNWASFYLPVGLYVNMKGKSIRGDVYTKWFSLGEIRKLHTNSGFEILEIQGVLHIPTRIRNGVFLAALQVLDRLCRKSVFRYFAPQIYVRARKVTAV